MNHYETTFDNLSPTFELISEVLSKNVVDIMHYMKIKILNKIKEGPALS